MPGLTLGRGSSEVMVLHCEKAGPWGPLMEQKHLRYRYSEAKKQHHFITLSRHRKHSHWANDNISSVPNPGI